MGGKTLKFPTRKKYVAPIEKKEESPEEKTISEEEHQKRMEILKELGLIKERKKETQNE